MKRNIRIASAAAAALLAVAPVAANVVNVNNTVFAKGTNDGSNENNAIDVTLTASTSTQPKDGDKGTAYNGKVNVAVASSAGTASTSASKWIAQYNHRDMTDNDIFKVGFSYSFKGTATITGLDPDKYYSVNGGQAVKPNAAGTITDIAVSTSSFNLTDSSISGFPYFTDKNNNTLNNGAAVDALASSDNNINAVLTAAKSKVNFFANSSDKTARGEITTTASDIKSQLQEQGITVKDNGTFTAPEAGFFVTLTGTNLQNGKTATVKVAFKGNKDTNAYPVIYVNNAQRVVQADQYEAAFKNAKYTVRNGSDFNPLAPNGQKIYAEQNTMNHDKLDLAVVSNNVNTKVAGTYTVSVKATNTAGLSTVYTYSVVVPAVQTNPNARTIKYVPGYSVNVWQVNGPLVSFANKRLMDGTNVELTGEKATVNGTTYYQVKVNGVVEGYVQAGYLGEANEASSNTDTKADNGETAVKGIATVHYNGKGGVALLNGAGKYQSQWVSNGSQWKVFAKKTINGRVMYRLGTDNQWIPADYVTVD